MTALDIEREEAEFEAWWESDGQFGRAGGGQYEKTFAYNAWMYKAECAAQTVPSVPAQTGISQPGGGDGLTAAHAKIYRDAIAQVCEGWNISLDLRKLLETALWAEPEPSAIAAHVSGQGGENARERHERRFEFLHSNNKDAEGWEWGVARVRVGSDGKVEFLWGLSDHSDIDAAIAAKGSQESKAAKGE